MSEPERVVGDGARDAELETLRREVERLRFSASSTAPTVLQAILDHSPHGIIVCDNQGKLTLHNRAAERIWAGSATADSISDWRHYRGFHKDGRPYQPDDWGMARCLETQQPIAAEEVWIERFDGTRALLLGSSAPLVRADGRVEGALAVFADITELHRLHVAEGEARKRIAKLQAVTAALSEARLPDDVAKVVARDMAAVVGADQAGLAVAAPDGLSLQLMTDHSGLTPSLSQALASISADAQLPVAEAYRTGKPVYITSRKVSCERYPQAPEVSAPPVQALVCLPLVMRGVNLGAIRFAFLESRSFDGSERELLADLATRAASALERTRLYENEQRARRRLELLAKASRRLAESGLELRPVLDGVVTELGDALHSSVAIHLRDGEWLHAAAEYHPLPEARDALRSLAARAPLRVGEGFAGTVALTGKSLLLSPLDPREAAQRAAAGYREFVERHPMYALISAPLRTRGRIIGVLTALRIRKGDTYTPDDLQLVEEIADRAAIAIENARLFAEAQDATRAREENEARLQAVTDALPALVSFVNRDQRYQFVNGAYERWFGREKSTIVGKTLQEALGTSAYERIRPHVEKVLSGQQVHYQAVLPYRDGGERFVEATYVPQHGPAGVAGFVALVADVSDRMILEHENLAARSRAEQLYQFAQAVVNAERIEDVFEAALDAITRALGTHRTAILLFDPEGVMRFRAWRGLSDDYRRQVEGHSPWSAAVTHPQPILVSDAGAEPSLSPYRALFAAEGIGALAFIPLVTRGQLLGKFMVYHDRRHEFSQHELELARAIANHLASVIARFTAVAALQETIRYNELFAGILAHDLRNPLGGMMTAAELLLHRQAGESERVTKPLTRILSSGERMTRMIDQMLDFTRLRVGAGIDIQPREANLAVLCREVLGEFELAHPDWRIELQCHGDADGIWDPDRLLQIISNLVANAGQHGRLEGAIRVEVDGRAPDLLRLRVHNQGVIPPDLLKSIFDPFRSTRHRRDKSRGLGLGLFIVKEIASAHGGTVDVSSCEDAGTSFTICLPRHTRPRLRGDGDSGRVQAAPP